jgi:tetratricopeptide (TPR) repeat protein
MLSLAVSRSVNSAVRLFVVKLALIPDRAKNNCMSIILPRILFTSLTLVCLFQICPAQSGEKSKPEEKLTVPTISIPRCDKTTKNVEAERFCNSGLDLTVQQKLDQAIAAFTEAIKLDPNYADAYNRRGVAFSWKKNNDSAIADFTKAIELNPKRVEFYVNRGSIYFVEEKKYKLAVDDFTKAIKLDPKNDFLYLTRARIYDALGLENLVEADLQKADELRNAPKQ